MSRKKLILSLLLMAVLVSVGMILPSIHRHQTATQQDKKRKLPQTGNLTEKPSVKKPSAQTKLQYLGFEDLETFFPTAQTEDLKKQLTAYLQEAGDTDITSVTFLIDETTYPSSREILLSFALSDGSMLSVTCQTASGTFTFGEGNLTVHSDNTPDMRSYTRQTDDTLPAVTTEEIETMQEGGYADTANTPTGTNAEEVTP